MELKSRKTRRSTRTAKTERPKASTAAFVQKLLAMTKDKSRASLSQAAGLPQNAISDYINKGYWPRLDTAKALAELFDVSLDWLTNDSAGPDAPPPAAATAELLGDEALMREVAKRLRLAELAFIDVVNRAKNIKWEEVEEALVKRREDEPLSDMLQEAMRVVKDFDEAGARARERFNPWYFGSIRHETMPGANLSRESFDEATMAASKDAADLRQRQAFRHATMSLLQIASRAPDRGGIFMPGSNWTKAAGAGWYGPPVPPAKESSATDGTSIDRNPDSGTVKEVSKSNSGPSRKTKNSV